jgi:hypothetical protein
MKQHANTKIRPELEEKQNGQKSPDHSQQTAAPDLATLSRTDIQNLSREDILTLQQTYGNRAVTRLLEQRLGNNGGYFDSQESQRPEEEEEPPVSAVDQEEDKVPGPRSTDARDDELTYPGPRSAAARGVGVQQRSVAGMRAPTAQRASPSSSATGNIGDAIDVDGEAMYGWTRTISWVDVARVVRGVIPTASSDEEMPRIVIFSGTQGDEEGHLVNDATSRGFVNEDQATANDVMNDNPGVQVEVVDVVTQYRTKGDLTSIYGYTDYIRILGWCYSALSYALGDTITSNWWPAPDDY